MQHGQAVPADVDPDRPLTAEGLEAVAQVARHVAVCGVTVDRIVHSGKTRAAQTAAILADVLGCPRVDQVPDLTPKGDVHAVAAMLGDPGLPGSVAVVGHLPSLDRLASLLVTGDPEAHVVAFRNAGLVRLIPAAERSGYSVEWIVTPEVARP